MLELYEAYATYDEVMDLTEAMIRDVAREVLGTTALQWEGKAIDLGPGFPSLDDDDAVLEHNPEISRDRLPRPRSAARRIAQRLRRPRQAGLRLGQAAAGNLREDGRARR